MCKTITLYLHFLFTFLILMFKLSFQKITIDIFNYFKKRENKSGHWKTITNVKMLILSLIF